MDVVRVESDPVAGRNNGSISVNPVNRRVLLAILSVNYYILLETAAMTAVFGRRTGYGIKCALIVLFNNSTVFAGLRAVRHTRRSLPVAAAQVNTLALPILIIRNSGVSVNVQVDLSGNIGIFAAVIMDYQLIGTARNIGSALVPSNLTVCIGKEVGRLAVHRKAVSRVEIARKVEGNSRLTRREISFYRGRLSLIMPSSV